MSTIYKTIKGSHIIVDSAELTIKGTKYVLDVSDVANITAYPLSTLATLGEAFDFITQYYPYFEQCSEAAELDDLDCLIENECEPAKFYLLTEMYGSDPAKWEKERDQLYQMMIDKAIENYKNTF